MVAIGIGAADINSFRALQIPFVPVTDLNSLGNSYPEVTALMRTALGIATDLVDPPTSPGSK